METEKKEDTVKIKKSHMFAIVGGIVMVMFFVFAAQAIVANSSSPSTVNSPGIQAGNAGGTLAPVVGGKQIVQLSVSGLQYNPNPIRVKKGVPVEIQVDMNSVRGCLRSIQIPAFGVRKIVNENDNKIEFTPDKAGTFAFSCFMGMGKGQIVVEDENGAVPGTVNTANSDIPKGASCGAGGGCGCGGN